MYTEDQLKESRIKVELNKQAAIDQEKYPGQSRMQELLGDQFDDYKFVEVAALKITPDTRAIDLVNFGQLCNDMTPEVAFSLKYNNELRATRPNNMGERVDMILDSERYRRRRQNEDEQKAVDKLDDEAEHDPLTCQLGAHCPHPECA
jgi:hypothetical protein